MTNHTIATTVDKAASERIFELRDFAQCIEYYLNNSTKPLRFREYVELNGLQTRLSAYAEMLDAEDKEGFLAEALGTAAKHFAYVKT